MTISEDVRECGADRTGICYRGSRVKMQPVTFRYHEILLGCEVTEVEMAGTCNARVEDNK